MRFNINLALRKYEDVRRFYVRWGAALAILAATAVLLATLSYLRYSRSAAAAQQTRELQQQIAALEKERDQAVAFENRPENRDVAQEKKFWNSQIAKRSFSWTQLFNEMQRIMPRRAFLNSVQPELTPENRLRLRLTITGEKAADARELQEKMETSNRFHAPHIVAEGIQKETKPGMAPTYKFEIETDYTPPNSASPSQPAQGQRSQGTPLPQSARSKEGL